MNILLLGPEWRNKQIKSFLEDKGNQVTTGEDKISIDCLKERSVDFIILSGYAPIVKPDVINAYKRRIINLHISLLPYGRGIGPNVWAWFLKHPHGVTIHLVSPGIDEGEILFQRQVEFTFEETLQSSHNKLLIYLQELLFEKWDEIIKENYEVRKQDAIGDRGLYHNRKQTDRLMAIFPKKYETPVIEVSRRGVEFMMSEEQFWRKYEGKEAFQFTDEKLSQIKVRPVTDDDKETVWLWHNDPVTRQMFKKNDTVPWQEHCSWFSRMLKDNNRLMLIGEFSGQDLGVIRFDQNCKGVYDVSININPIWRSKGFGKILLNKAIEYIISDREVLRLTSSMKTINRPSLRAFECNGFKIIAEKDDHFFCEREIDVTSREKKLKEKQFIN